MDELNLKVPALPLDAAHTALEQLKARDTDLERARLEGRLTNTALDEAAAFADQVRSMMAAQPTLMDRIFRSGEIQARERLRGQAIERVGGQMVELVAGIHEAHNAYTLGRIWRIVQGHTEADAARLATQLASVRASAFQELWETVKRNLERVDRDRDSLQSVKDPGLRELLEKKMSEHALRILAEYDRGIDRIAELVAQVRVPQL